MPSLIPGFEYDIFISYRQKDNKYDGWVTEFADNLRKELEATFKDDISVYFDINPHDGLLESYDVGESLREKLKCLIFIPIISRTYCDPKSFAWEHEFKPFIEQASKDHFGLKVKLANGNVASRVLPVRIHDIDDEDIKLYESVLGGVLRGVEFIYKEAGINRSLTRDDDDKKNLNLTRYRNQMNKVALAIKEIVLGLKSASEEPSSKISARITSKNATKANSVKEDHLKFSMLSKQNLFTGLLITALLTMSLLFLFPKIFKRDKLKELKDHSGKISLAVMPFENLTGDTTLNWFGRGISSLIINGLGNSSELSVADEYTMFEVIESINQTLTAGISGSMAKEVSRRVGAETYISGSFQGTENLYWILVNLVNTKTGDVIWTNKVEGNLKSAGYLDLANLLCSEIKNCLEIKAIEENTDYDFREIYPKSSEAYRYFIEGMNEMMNRQFSSSIGSFRNALELDSAFTFASFFLAWAYATTDQDVLAREWTIKAYHNKNRIPAKYQPWLEQWYAFYVSKQLDDILRYTTILENSGIRSRWLWYDIGSTYCNFLMKDDKAIRAFEKISEISFKNGAYWKHKSFYLRYSKVLHRVGKHKEEREIYSIYQNLFPEDTEILGNMATCFLSRGDIAAANEYIRKIRSRFDDGLSGQKSLEITLGSIYQDANFLDKAEEYFREAYDQDHKKTDPGRKGFREADYRLARLIILDDTDISEGMEIVNRNLDINPDDWYFLGLKGWGLYKLGKYDEAIKVLKMADQKSVYFDFEVYQHIQEVEKTLSSQ
jgi:TolB-like protein